MPMMRLVRLRRTEPDVYRVESIFKSPSRPAYSLLSYENGVAVIEAPPHKTDAELQGMYYAHGRWMEGGGNYNPKRAIRKRKDVGVCFVGPLSDGSGYAEGARNYIAALNSVGVQVQAKPVTYEPARSDYGLAGRVCEDAIKRKIDYGFKVAMMTPDYFYGHFEPDCYNIGLFLWETNLLPKEWVPACNQMDEIWVPCEWNAQVCRTSGVTRPIRVFGCTTSEENYNLVHPYNIPGLNEGAYKFYSIFQWTERKNPRGLLMAYLTAFTAKDNVALIIKSYRSNFSQGEQDAVRAEVDKIKRDVGGPNLPPVFLVPWMLTKFEILGLHK